VDERNRPFANKFFYNGGTGASHRRDGMNATSWPSNISLTPAEVVEQLVPCRVVYKKLRPRSGGDGQYRGGLGQDILLESRSPAPVFMVFLAERTKFAAPGVAGGEPGDCGALVIDGQVADPKKQHVLKPGGTVLMRTPGGGGYGDPGKRSQAARQADRRLGFLG
jgi:N-methylhydantoinase B